jgi:hypothetical protein
LIVVDVHPSQIFSDRSPALVTFAVASVVVVVVLVQVFVPVELVAQRLTWLEPSAGMGYERRLAAAAGQLQRYAGGDVMEVVGGMGQDMVVVVVGQSLKLEKPIVGLDEDWAVRSLVEVVVESHSHQLGSCMAALKQEMVANYSLEILDMDRVLEGGLVVVVQEPFAVVLTCMDSALELW